MLTERRDYLLRLIQQAGVAAARIRELLTGEAAPVDDLARQVDQEITALLGDGTQAALLQRLDADTAVRLLGDRDRVQAWVELLQAKADVLTRAGDETAAAALRTRAAALRAAAEQRESSGS